MGTDSDGGVERRSVLRGAGLLGAGALATAAGAGAAVAQADPFEGWFDEVSNYEGVVDERGADEVTVAVGAPGNGGALAFGPAAVRVDPGATVVWEWTGEGGSHDVAAEDGAFASTATAEAGHTFERSFDAAAVHLYKCNPHEGLGMRGAVVVGDAAPEAATAGGGDGSFTEPNYGGWFADVGNFDGTVDMAGTDRVTVRVGAEGNGGALAFDPPAVRVDPGTTVVWEWTGEGGSHDVHDDEVGYGSPTQSAAGATYALEFSGEGVSTYACAPHEEAGMKGAVVVGDPAAGAGGTPVGEFALWGLVVAAVLSPFAVGEYFHRRGGGDRGSAASP